ncbi:N-acetyltransferase [Candidatus Micrarchaeota archaeon]|nr:N-acetyltransferase [Candidatus Micrarchaeota archaeon]
MANIHETAVIGKNVSIGENVQVHEYAVVYDNTVLGDNSIVGPHAIVGHPLGGYFAKDPEYKNPETRIGKGCIIRARSTVYCGVTFADGVKTGTNAVIRERCSFGENTSIGTMVQVENDTIVGTRVSIETGSHVTAKMIIEDDVFFGAHVVTTNDNKMLRPIDVKNGKTTTLKGPTVRKGTKLGSNSCVLPGIEIGENCVIGAGAVVTRNIPPRTVAVGVPAKPIGTVKEEECV